jgi:hypothetical protein
MSDRVVREEWFDNNKVQEIGDGRVMLNGYIVNHGEEGKALTYEALCNVVADIYKDGYNYGVEVTAVVASEVLTSTEG